MSTQGHNDGLAVEPPAGLETEHDLVDRADEGTLLVQVSDRAHAPDADPLVRTGRRVRTPKLLYWVCIVWLVVITLLGLLAPLLPIGSYITPVGLPKEPAFKAWPEFLGTDSLGRSTLSRLLYGARYSMVIGLGAAAFGFVVGTAIGIVAGYFRGIADRVIGFVLDVFLAFPPLIVLLVLVSVLQPSITTLALALGLIVIPTFARLARASTLVWADRPFVVAARSYGATNRRIIFKELLGNVILPLLTLLPVIVASLMIAEGSLSYLGFGLPPPEPSWGGMISAGTKELRREPMLVMIPAMTVFITVFALNIVGERVRSRYEIPGAR